jgi:ribonuclease HI
MWTLSKDPKPTNQSAELEACHRALRVSLDVTDKRVDGERLEQLVIKSDSEYLVKGMTEYVLKWKKNGYKNCKGKPVINADWFQALEETVAELESYGVQVFFWLVPRQHNQEADWLARSALAREEGMDMAEYFGTRGGTIRVLL